MIGRHLQEISSNKFIIPRIYALDPARPNFDNRYNECIKKSDAAYVQVIHTNGELYGLSNPVGHSDFYVNGGRTQPGCLTNMCSHKFAWIVFQESVIDEGSFMARKCDTFENFIKGHCDSNEISYMGYLHNRTLPIGIFHLLTYPSGSGSALGFKGIDISAFENKLGQFFQTVVASYLSILL
jgi:hypothetical protein